VIDRWGRHRNVLCEGKAQNRDAEYLLGRQLSFKVIVIFLTTDLEEAIATVQSREHNCVTEDIVRRTYRKCQHDREMLLKGGVMMWSESRDDAIKLIEQWCDGELR
jgi:predicted kinase